MLAFLYEIRDTSNFLLMINQLRTFRNHMCMSNEPEIQGLFTLRLQHVQCIDNRKRNNSLIQLDMQSWKVLTVKINKRKLLNSYTLYVFYYWKLFSSKYYWCLASILNLMIIIFLAGHNGIISITFFFKFCMHSNNF